MAELAARDGMPPPADLPRGEFYSSVLPGARVRIDRADPRILISGELLDIIADPPYPMPHAWLDTAGCTPGHGYVGAVLHIHGVNQHVVYRVVDYVPRVNGYIGEWPD